MGSIEHESNQGNDYSSNWDHQGKIDQCSGASFEETPKPTLLIKALHGHEQIDEGRQHDQPIYPIRNIIDPLICRNDNT